MRQAGEGAMTSVLLSVEGSMMGTDRHSDGCQCDDCRIGRARRQWYESWRRQTGRRVPELEYVSEGGARHE